MPAHSLGTLSGCAGLAECSAGRQPSPITISRCWMVRMLWLSTAPRCLGLTMPATAPSLATAATQASKAGQFSNSRSTEFPGCTPRCFNTCAMWLA